MLYQGYGSKYLKFAGAMPILQSINRDNIKKKYYNKYLWFIRNKKSIEQNEKNNPKTSKLSQYWRPCAVKLWNHQNSNHHNNNNNNIIPFDKLLENIKFLNHKQMESRKRQIEKQKQYQQHHHHKSNHNHNNGHHHRY